MEAAQLTQKISEGALLLLDEQRVVSFKDGKFAYTYYFNRIAQRDWERFFDGIIFTSRNEGKAEITTFDWDTAGCDLVEQTIDRVEGYSGDFMSKIGWKSKLPLRHVRPVAYVLRGVSPSKIESDKPFDPESIEVLLDAAWGMLGPGKMTGYEGLVHRFSPVTIELRRKFYRTGAQSRVVGGSRNGTTIHALRHKALLKVYDELIQSVEGYGIAGRALSTREEIIREMDAYHKVKAAEQLFAGTSESDETQDETSE
jgi:hypothetical protein